MTGAHLREARNARGWTQAQTARRLGLSQPYLSQLETGQRRLPARRARAFMRKLPYRGQLPPTVLPVSAHVPAESLAAQLGALGYPRFAHLRADAPANPAAVLLAALAQDHLEARVAEALPWLVLAFPDLDWDFVLSRARLRNLQNRAGFVVSLARARAEAEGRQQTADDLRRVEDRLEESRLAREDAFGQTALMPSERRWLRDARPPLAAHWNLLTDMSPDRLRYDNFPAVS